MKISTSFIVVQILVGVLSEAFASSASNQALGIGEEIESMVCLTIYFKRFLKKIPVRQLSDSPFACQCQRNRLLF